MSATFITQQQFDEIDKCMLFVRDSSYRVNHFVLALPSQLRWGAWSAIPQIVQAGPRTRNQWIDHSDADNYLTINRHLDSLLFITDHIITGIGGLSPADRKSPVSKLSGLVAPPKPPVFPWYPRATCLQLISWQTTGLRSAIYKARYTNANYRDVREGVYKILPRLIDFTSRLLQIAQTMPLNSYQREDLPYRAAAFPFFYTVGMAGLANLIAQQDRISKLLEQASPYVDPPDNDKSLARFRSDLEIAGVYLRQARRYCREVAALRGV